eukprot:RCo035242
MRPSRPPSVRRQRQTPPDQGTGSSGEQQGGAGADLSDFGDTPAKGANRSQLGAGLESDEDEDSDDEDDGSSEGDEEDDDLSRVKNNPKELTRAAAAAAAV